MPTELNVQAVHQGDMRIDAQIGHFKVEMDYPRTADDPKAAPTPLELLLSSLAGCAGNTVAALLTSMRQPLDGLEVKITGQRKDEHPTVITDIDMVFILTGNGIAPQMVEKAMKMSEEQICPVWNMLKKETNIRASYKIQ